VIERMRALPGVQMAAVGSSLPTMGNPRMEYVVEDAPADTKRPSVEVALAGEGYFETLQVTALRGRLFEALEYNGGQNVALVNQTMANQAWAGKDPVGKRVRLFEGNVPGPWLTVVGVFPEMMISAQRTTVEPALYQPYRQDAARQFMSLVARTRVPPASLGAALRGVVQAVDRDLPARDLSTMEDLLAMNRWPIRVFGSMFAIFAGIALLLATVGLYAVVAYGVSRRTQEIGVRVALGATSPGILRMVFAGGIRQALIGLVLGLAAAFGVTRLLSALLAGVSPTDPLTFGLVAAVLLGAATLGCLMPARRAMRVDPVVALRHE
jgi:putative ABC transport system permease protein